MQRVYSKVEPYDAVRTEQSLVRLEALARLMDSAFVIPGTSIRMGLDGLIGLVPATGETLRVSGNQVAGPHCSSITRS